MKKVLGLDKTPIRPLILGIDPGFSGGLALYNFEEKKLLEVIDMPTIKVKEKTEVDISKISSFIDHFGNDIKFSVIEEVGVMTGREGRQGMFRFGVGVGVLRGVLGSYLIPTFSVTPSVWKGLLNLTSNKNDSLLKAKKMFPDSAHFFTRKKDDGRAEAALLALFGTRFLGLYDKK